MQSTGKRASKVPFYIPPPKKKTNNNNNKQTKQNKNKQKNSFYIKSFKQLEE